MALTFEGMSPGVEYTMFVANAIFSVCFIVEAMLKLTAFGLAYF